jgi:hypothetical protein
LLRQLDAGKDFFRHPVHALQSFTDARAADVEDHRIDCGGAVVANIRGDFVGTAIDALTLCGIDLTAKHQPSLTPMALSD